MKKLVKKWFETWELGDFTNIPVEDNFRHTSPYGTIEGKNTYLGLVDSNRKAFLGYKFEIHDEIYADGKACVRYTGRKGDYTLDVSEWFFQGENLIQEIVSYYNVGRQLSDDENFLK